LIKLSDFEEFRLICISLDFRYSANENGKISKLIVLPLKLVAISDERNTDI